MRSLEAKCAYLKRKVHTSVCNLTFVIHSCLLIVVFIHIAFRDFVEHIKEELHEDPKRNMGENGKI